jgi:ABC-type phosphate/phosphonate transport system substrate-binding protein
LGDPDLLLAQGCGYPLVTRYRHRLRYVATPRYTASGCLGGQYQCRIVVRTADPAEKLADLAGRRAAINQRSSNSGMNLFRAAIAPLAGGRDFFASVVVTGSHAASLRAVVEGSADVASIDPVSFAHAIRDDPALAADLRTVGWTGLSPGLPLVTAITTPEPVVRALRRAVIDAVRSVDAMQARSALLLDGVERLPAQAYERLLGVERSAARLDYPILA